MKKHLLAYFNLTKFFYLGIITALIVDAGLIYIFSDLLKSSNQKWWIIILYLLFLLAQVIIPTCLLGLFLYKSFTGSSGRQRLIIIVHSYLGVVILFAAIYFAFNIIGELKAREDVNDYFVHQIAIQKFIDSTYQILPPTNKLALRGISNNLWTGVDNPDYYLLLQLDRLDGKQFICNSCYSDYFVNRQIESVPINVSISIAKLQLPWSQLFRFQYNHIIANFGDCLYFSGVTIITIGYGDISPNLWYTKMAALVEALCGIVIFVFSVNLLFMSWHKKNKDG